MECGGALPAGVDTSAPMGARREIGGRGTLPFPRSEHIMLEMSARRQTCVKEGAWRRAKKGIWSKRHFMHVCANTFLRRKKTQTSAHSLFARTISYFCPGNSAACFAVGRSAHPFSATTPEFALEHTFLLFLRLYIYDLHSPPPRRWSVLSLTL